MVVGYVFVFVVWCFELFFWGVFCLFCCVGIVVLVLFLVGSGLGVGVECVVEGFDELVEGFVD